MVNSTVRFRAPRLWTSAIVVAGILAAGGCASSPPPPDEALQAARMAIGTAEKSDAARYAPVELGEARERLVAADASVVARDMVLAEQAALQSRSQAELAEAKADAAKAAAVNDAMRKGTGTLIEEMKRSAGDRT